MPFGGVPKSTNAPLPMMKKFKDQSMPPGMLITDKRSFKHTFVEKKKEIEMFID